MSHVHTCFLAIQVHKVIWLRIDYTEPPITWYFYGFTPINTEYGN